jgi:membrane protein YqaA with SNARE-associated domain
VPIRVESRHARGLPGSFLVAFLAATILPAYSEDLFASLLAARYDPLARWAWATAGNTLGAAVNWLLGRYLLHFQHRKWFSFKPGNLGRAQRWFQRYPCRAFPDLVKSNGTRP